MAALQMTGDGTEQGSPLPPVIGRVAVLGAGVMGSCIAAHLANAGIAVLLLDRASPSEAGRNALITTAIESLEKSKPPALADLSFVSRIAAGNFDDDLAGISGCDWIIEAVSEDLAIKHALLARVAAHLRSDAILSSNTSGLPLHRIAEGLPAAMRARFLGTHFFNPPRYMRLVELIPTIQTSPEIVSTLEAFCEQRLGKTVVRASDVPNFIANRIGTFAILNTFRVMQQQKLSIAEVDELTGSIIGWPKSGTFRLADMVGIDVLCNVSLNLQENTKDERDDVPVPALLTELVSRNLLGDKTGSGFYRKQKGSTAEGERAVLDPATFAYVPIERASFTEIAPIRKVEPAAERVRALFRNDASSGRACAFYWSILPELFFYAAHRIGEVAETIADIDAAMRAGFNWELGPFEMWDAAGLELIAEHMAQQGWSLPPALVRLRQSRGASWYREDGREYFDPGTGSYRAAKGNGSVSRIADARRANGVFAGTEEISLVDLGGGIGCFELHSKVNVLGTQMVDFLRKTLQPESRAVNTFRAFVVSTDAPNFSAGANLAELVEAMQSQDWSRITDFVRVFQEMALSVKFCPRPVVVAAAGLCLGGAMEVALHGARRQPHLEFYGGLVESSVGLLPGGGGCKEMLFRALSAAGDSPAESVSLQEAIKQTFEAIATAKVSSSAFEARRLRYIRDTDVVTMNRARLIADAKRTAQKLASDGYTAPLKNTLIPAPGKNILANLRMAIFTMRESQFISEHDATVAGHIARVLCGGENISAGTPLTEQRMLDLEREAFLSLCGETKTLERIAHTLKTGKPLRN